MFGVVCAPTESYIHNAYINREHLRKKEAKRPGFLVQLAGRVIGVLGNQQIALYPPVNVC